MSLGPFVLGTPIHCRPSLADFAVFGGAAAHWTNDPVCRRICDDEGHGLVRHTHSLLERGEVPEVRAGQMLETRLSQSALQHSTYGTRCSSVDMSWGLALCGPRPKEGAKLAQMTPAARFDWRVFCCILQPAFGAWMAAPEEAADAAAAIPETLRAVIHMLE